MKTLPTRELRHITVDDCDLDLSCFPDFLILGPQRTGTTWLTKSLRLHPQVLMARPKELYYFDHLSETVPRVAAMPEGWSRELSWYLSRFRLDEQEAAERTRQCLADYGRPFEPRVFGEATASYAVGIPPEVRAEMLEINPELRGILLVRHPVERAWSMAKYVLGFERNREVEDISMDEFLEFLQRPFQLRSGRFTELIEDWRAALGAERVLVESTDHIRRDPQGVIRRVSEFLGVEWDRTFLPERMRSERTNASSPEPIPHECRSFLEETFADEVAGLRRMGLLET